jgi:hypothetical protein
MGKEHFLDNDIFFQHLERLEPPSKREFKEEWQAERLDQKFRAGIVVGMLLDEDDPTRVTVYYDGGRRRDTGAIRKGIVLEGMHAPLKWVIKQRIKVGDLVKTNLPFARLWRVAAAEDLTEQGVSTPFEPFNPDYVVGVIIWENI